MIRHHVVLTVVVGTEEPMSARDRHDLISRVAATAREGLTATAEVKVADPVTGVSTIHHVSPTLPVPEPVRMVYHSPVKP